MLLHLLSTLEQVAASNEKSTERILLAIGPSSSPTIANRDTEFTLQGSTIKLAYMGSNLSTTYESPTLIGMTRTADFLNNRYANPYGLNEDGTITITALSQASSTIVGIQSPLALTTTELLKTTNTTVVGPNGIINVAGIDRNFSVITGTQSSLAITTAELLKTNYATISGLNQNVGTSVLGTNQSFPIITGVQSLLATTTTSDLLKIKYSGVSDLNPNVAISVAGVSRVFPTIAGTQPSLAVTTTNDILNGRLSGLNTNVVISGTGISGSSTKPDSESCLVVGSTELWRSQYITGSNQQHALCVSSSRDLLGSDVEVNKSASQTITLREQ